MGSILKLTSPSNVSIWRYSLVSGSRTTNPCGGNIDDLELVVLVNWDTCTLPRHTLREGIPRQTRICPFICQSKRDSNEWVRGLKDLLAKYYTFPLSCKRCQYHTNIYNTYICMILTLCNTYIYLYDTNIFCKTSDVYGNLVRIWVFSPTNMLA